MTAITTILGSDVIRDSRTDINNNFNNLNSGKIETSALDTDNTLSANSDSKIASQKAVKSYIDTGGNPSALSYILPTGTVLTYAGVGTGTSQSFTDGFTNLSNWTDTTTGYGSATASGNLNLHNTSNGQVSRAGVYRTLVPTANNYSFSATFTPTTGGGTVIAAIFDFLYASTSATITNTSIFAEIDTGTTDNIIIGGSNITTTASYTITSGTTYYMWADLVSTGKNQYDISLYLNTTNSKPGSATVSISGACPDVSLISSTLTKITADLSDGSTSRSIVVDDFVITGPTIYVQPTVPSLFLYCNGSAVSRTTYATLFGIIGTAYGSGNGTTTFNLPNLGTRVIAGYSSGDNAFSSISSIGGESTHTLNIGEMPSHVHTAVLPSTGAASGGGTSAKSSASSATDATGGGLAHNNLQPYIVMSYIIKY